MIQYRFFSWDWKEQPPLQEILEYVTSLSPVFFSEVETNEDCYAWFFATGHCSRHEIQTLWQEEVFS